MQLAAVAAVAQSLEDLETRARSSYYYAPAGDEDPSTGTLHLKLVSTGADWEELRVEPR